MSKIGKVHLDRCIEVAGDPRAGVLLYYIMRWMRSTRVKYGGWLWATSSREEWAKQTGTSLKKVKADLDKLSVKELIFREKHMFKNRSVLFVRPTESCLQALKAPAGWIKKSGVKGQNGTGQSYPNGTDQSGPNGTDLYKLTSGTHTETQKTATGFAVATPEPESCDKTPGKTDNACISKNSGYHPEVGKIIPFPEGQGGPVVMATANEKAASLLASAKKPIDTLKPDKVYSLVHVWREHCKTKDQVAPAVTDKMRAQLKRLIKLWPEGEAPAILAYTMANWFDFTYVAEKDYGGFKSPDMPEINHLVKYEYVAVTLWLKAQAKAAKPEPVQSIAQPVVKQPKHVKEKPATMAEILAIEEAFAKGAA